MESARPSLDLKHFGEICPDKNGKSKFNRCFTDLIDMGDFSSACNSCFYQI